MGRVEGKVAIITGGASGMGKASALMLAREGAKVVIIDISPAGTDTASEIRATGGEAIAYQVDVREGARLKEIYAEVASRYGSLDILVNAAGIGILRPFLDVDEDFLQNYFEVNFKGVWNSCQAAVPHMLRVKYGKIVNYSSVTGVHVADPGQTAYSSTKGAVMGMTMALAAELGPSNITVNAILPGMMDTPMVDAVCLKANPTDPQSIKDAMSANIPMGRLGTSEEAAKVTLFLASDDSSYVTGIGLVIDGGNGIPENPGAGFKPPES